MQPVSARERALAAQVSGILGSPYCLWRTGHDPISWNWRMGHDGRAHFLARWSRRPFASSSSPYLPSVMGQPYARGVVGNRLAMRQPSSMPLGRAGR